MKGTHARLNYAFEKWHDMGIPVHFGFIFNEIIYTMNTLTLYEYILYLEYMICPSGRK